MKKIFLYFPGFCDEPIEELEGKTPLEVAKCPNLELISNTSKKGSLNIEDNRLIDPENLFIKMVEGEVKEEFSGSSLARVVSRRSADGKVCCAFNWITQLEMGGEIHQPAELSLRESGELVRNLNHFFAKKGVEFVLSGNGPHLLLIDKNIISEIETDVQLPPSQEMASLGAKEVQLLIARHPVLQSLRGEISNYLSSNDINKVKIDLGENPANSIWIWGGGEFGDNAEQNLKALEGVLIGPSGMWQGVADRCNWSFVPYSHSVQSEAIVACEQSFKDAIQSNQEQISCVVDVVYESSFYHDYIKKIRLIEAVDMHILSHVKEILSDGGKIAICTAPIVSSVKKTRLQGQTPFLISSKDFSAADAAPFCENSMDKFKIKWKSEKGIVRDFFSKGVS